MGGVNKNDAMVGNYSFVRKSYKWTTTMFFHFMEEAVFNSYILRKKRGSKKRFLQFKLNLIRSILREAHIDVDIAEAGHNKYVGRHCPELIPPTENKDKPQERCVVCKKYVQTTLAYVLLHASNNIMKYKIEGATEH